MKLQRFEYSFEEGAGGNVLRLAGFLNESANLPAADGPITFPLTVDLGEIALMNSLGLRKWMRFIEPLSARGPVTLRRCPETMVRQFCLVTGAIAQAKVATVLAPYRCVGCSASEAFELVIGTDVSPTTYWEEPPARKCSACGGRACFDELPEAFFCFAVA